MYPTWEGLCFILKCGELKTLFSRANGTEVKIYKVWSFKAWQMSRKSRSLSFLFFKKKMNLTRAFEHNFWLRWREFEGFEGTNFQEFNLCLEYTVKGICTRSRRWYVQIFPQQTSTKLNLTNIILEHSLHARS